MSTWRDNRCLGSLLTPHEDTEALVLSADQVLDRNVDVLEIDPCTPYVFPLSV